MFKNKEIRDNVLLISMAVIVIFFLVYIFFPSGKDNTKKENNTKKPVKTVTPKKTKTPIIPVENVDKNKLQELNMSIEKEIGDIYLTILSSRSPFEEYQIEPLRKVIDESENEILKKYSKFSFFDLKDIMNIEFPEEYDGPCKFNIFLSMFLIKIVEEEALRKFADLAKIEFEKNIDLGCYALINNEIDRDYQVLPTLFYFKLLLDRLNVYPVNDDTAFFREKIGNIRDLSFSKHVLKISEFLSFAREPGRYRVEWVERDGFPDSDDAKSYASLSLKTINFLKQKYLVFPDPENGKNNMWIKELCSADSGSIELGKLNILNENPLNPLKNKKILYTPINPHFIVILDNYPGSGLTENEFVNRNVIKKLNEFYKNFQVIDFSEASQAGKGFKEQLVKFGNYLKKTIPLN